MVIKAHANLLKVSNKYNSLIYNEINSAKNTIKTDIKVLNI